MIDHKLTIASLLCFCPELAFASPATLPTEQLSIQPQLAEHESNQGSAALQINLNLGGSFNFGFVNPLSEAPIESVIRISNIDIDDNPDVGLYLFTVDTFVGEGSEQANYLNASGALSIFSGGILSFQQLGDYENTLNTGGTTLDGWNLNYFSGSNGDDAIENLQRLVNGEMGVGTGGANVNNLGEFGHEYNINDATMVITPAPSSMALLGLGSFAAKRRRRS